MSNTNDTSNLDHGTLEDHRLLADSELEGVSGGGTNGSNVAAGWNTTMSTGPIQGNVNIMTTDGLMSMYGRGNAGAIK